MDQQPVAPFPEEAPSNKNTRMLLSVIAILILTVIILLGAVVVVRHYNKTNKSTSVGSSIPVEASITPTGFTPSTIYINKGQTVVWTNYDSKEHIVAADPYPKDEALVGFKSPVLSQNQTYSFVFDKSGSYYYYDNLNPLSFKGTVIVK